MKKFILKLAAKILYKLGEPRVDKDGNEINPIIYIDFDKDSKNDLLELADKIALIVAELEKK